MTLKHSPQLLENKHHLLHLKFPNHLKPQIIMNDKLSKYNCDR